MGISRCLNNCCFCIPKLIKDPDHDHVCFWGEVQTGSISLNWQTWTINYISTNMAYYGIPTSAAVDRPWQHEAGGWFLLLTPVHVVEIWSRCQHVQTSGWMLELTHWQNFSCLSSWLNIWVCWVMFCIMFAVVLTVVVISECWVSNHLSFRQTSCCL